jgi:hypothetical protein
MNNRRKQLLAEQNLKIVIRHLIKEAKANAEAFTKAIDEFIINSDLLSDPRFAAAYQNLLTADSQKRTAEKKLELSDEALKNQNNMSKEKKEENRDYLRNIVNKTIEHKKIEANLKTVINKIIIDNKLTNAPKTEEIIARLLKTDEASQSANLPLRNEGRRRR